MRAWTPAQFDRMRDGSSDVVVLGQRLGAARALAQKVWCCPICVAERAVPMLDPGVREAERCINMARNNGTRPVGGQELTVGVRVLVRRNTEADVTGEIVEDYAAVTDPGGRGHAWAPVHRWAIVLDDGRLIFAGTEDLTIDPSSHRSAQDPDQAQDRDPDPAVPTPGRHRGE